MKNPVRIELMPLGQTLNVERGTPLQDVLFANGVEFPCGGRGRCKGCRVKVLAGTAPATSDDQKFLTQAELASGWRLACRTHAHHDLKLELAQWEAPILVDNTRFHFKPQKGLGAALDLGTTTLVAQLLDLSTGHVLAVQTALNSQAQFGADIMSRIDFAIANNGQARLQRIIREQLGALIHNLLELSGHRAEEIKQAVIVGNTVMHHLFCGIDVKPLARHPFEPADLGQKTFSAKQLGWPGKANVRFLPCLGGFVGSDILAGVLATRLHESPELAALVDLGTNGEIVVGNRERMVCASTAAGPAFEGARISMGMRAATGAISSVELRNGQFQCQVLGQVDPRGICGSGLVDAVAGGLELGRIQSNGRFAQGSCLSVMPPVELNQTDIRELQLAKGAIAAGIQLLAQQWGAELDDIKQIYLAGAFGNYINRASAHRIGLLPFGPDKVTAAGNTALLGAKLALFSLHPKNENYTDLLKTIRHISLKEDPQFQDVYVEQMGFPS